MRHRLPARAARCDEQPAHLTDLVYDFCPLAGVSGKILATIYDEPLPAQPALVEALERARLSAFLYHLLQRSAAANAVIGVAHHPGRSSSCARDDPVRHFVAVGDESGARRRLPCAACG